MGWALGRELWGEGSKVVAVVVGEAWRPLMREKEIKRFDTGIIDH